MFEVSCNSYPVVPLYGRLGPAGGGTAAPYVLYTRNAIKVIIENQLLILLSLSSAAEFLGQIREIREMKIK
jgi:hypothetical protein